ncbi:hypothetical protein [Sphingobacterium siyangense]|uniref:hypothetical protein n=1 Tax=Sphingobacterium siyangense TaxID=459529 RepID=UPI0028993EBA|nr:hypothetical protein [Sphingobacterium siyangense]
MWLNLKTEQKRLVLDQLSNIMGLPAFVIEKDWWVCIVLKDVFASKREVKYPSD